MARINRSTDTCYGSMALYTSIVHNIFLLYHVDMFVSVYKIDKVSFWIGETIFLLWNSLNDPLFGWISDKAYLFKSSPSQHNGLSSAEVVCKRLSAIQWNGPLFALSFLLFWVSWINPAIQFVLCLCLYDGFLTMIDLHHSALLADLAVSADARTRLNSYSSVFSAIGSASVFLSYAIWDKTNLTSFRFFCVVLTVFSFCGFMVSSKWLQKQYSKKQKDRGYDDALEKSCHAADTAQVKDSEMLKVFLKQLMSHKNFLWFSLMNLVQVFHCHFNSNFFPLFLENLLRGIITPTFASILLGISFVAPHINNLYFLWLCRKFGVYAVIQLLFFIKFSISVLMFTLGPDYTWLLCVFIASNRVFTEGTCKLLNLIISDLVDEDYVIHKRSQAVSALMFGTIALISKPGQTLAPLIGTWLLAVQTGHDIFESGNESGSIKRDVSQMSIEEQEKHRYGCFQLLVYIPIVCALIQLAVWSRFTMKGSRLRWIKSVRSGKLDDTV